MISCVRDTRKVAQAMRLGAQDYLSKPVQKAEMDEVLRFCLQHSAPGSPEAGEAIELGEGCMFFSATPQMQSFARRPCRWRSSISRCCCWARAGPAKKCWRT